MLGRAFFTLYLFVVLVILGAGWGLDRLYLSLSGPEQPDPLNRAFFTLLESRFSTPDESGAESPQERLQRYLSELQLSARVYQLSDLADSSLKQDVMAGEPVMLSAEQQRQVYYRLSGSPWVVQLILPAEPEQDGWYRVLLLVFYLLLALVIYLWIWPLVRDLRSLQKQARLIGRADAGVRVRLSQRSAVYSLSQEFNRMQQRIDELLASYREMTYAVSHELRTPLARMKFALELAQGDVPAAQRQNQLDNLRTDVTQMDALINQLLHYAGFETQTQALTLQQGAPGALCALVEGLIESITSRGAVTTTSVPDYMVRDYLAQRPVYCEWNLLERVLQNLLGNAAKYASGQVLVTLDFDQGCYRIRVEDDGPGIPKADAGRVFDSFVRLHQEPSLDREGFGLGLAIVKRILDWHSGSVALSKSESLGGACFTVRWPAPAEVAG
ncbi:ATP-binding protein [Gilvimarinus agarilyticus]|uniref:ATP-binding protein n=1 Tax=Gilvimarinus agarilyticus TaxID=679259 RepID=UPI00069734F7|nr:ATP-binding protein [Gilvimarinus agarilyticus]